MAIVNRIRRLFRADVHAILDAVEEPEAVLKQAIREMQEALDQKQGGLARTERALAALRIRESELEEEFATAKSHLDLALKEGSEELIRKSIAHKLAVEKRRKSLRKRIEHLKTNSSNLAEEIRVQQAQLNSVIERAKALTPLSGEEDAFSVAEAILTKRDSARVPSSEISDEEIELEWIRLRQGGAS